MGSFLNKQIIQDNEKQQSTTPNKDNVSKIRKVELPIKGYNKDDNISVLNVLYHRAQKLDSGRYGKDSLDIIYRDNNTGEKHHEYIEEPGYVYYMTNKNVPTPYNRMYIEKNLVHPVWCKYSEIKKSIAEETNNLDYFYDNIRNGNYRQNDKLHELPQVFLSDTNIEDYYRFRFNNAYKNESWQISKLYFDIETDIKNNIKGEFPEWGEAPVNAFTLVDANNCKVYTLLLDNPQNKLIEEFKQSKNIITELKEFIKEASGGYKQWKRFGLDKFEYKIMFYDVEIELIRDAFNIINVIKPDFALAWNIGFDLPYLIERIKVLGYDPASIICHPDFENKECYYFYDHEHTKFEERGDFAQISAYTVYLDQLITFASRRKGQRALASYKLDYIGQHMANVRKLDYSHITHKLEDLPYLDYKTFVFYNIMDTIVQYCIEHNVGDIDFVYNKAMTTNTRFAKVHRQTTYLVNRGISDFWNMGYVMGNNSNKGNPKEGFAGAFVADPTKVSSKPKEKVAGMPIMVCDNLDDFDYAALYPSIIDENNMSPPTQIGKVLFPNKITEEENKFGNEYFDRSVWFIEDYVSHDRLNFCHRYLHLASYEQMYHDIIKYFTTIKKSIKRFRLRDLRTGFKNMVSKLPEKRDKRTMVSTVDNTKERIMVNDVSRYPRNK